MRIVCSIQPYNESTFLFQYNKLFHKCQSLNLPRSTPWRDRYRPPPPLNFFQETELPTLFIWSIFWLSPKVNTLSHFSTLYLKHDNLSSPLALLLEEIDTCAHWVLCGKLNYGQLLFEAFLILAIILVPFSRKVNALSHFSTLCVTRCNKRCQPSQNEFSYNAALKLQTRVSCEGVIRFSWNLVALLVDAFCPVLQSVIFFVIFF